MRVAMARTSVTGVAYAPVLAVITPVVDWRTIDLAKRHGLERQIAAELEMRPDLADQIRRISEMAR
jgi:hypothetical protein